MAVSMNTSMRSDFMISDAAIPQRMEEFDVKQSAQAELFAKMLSDLDSGKSGAGIPSDLERALNELKENEKFEQALKVLDSEIRKNLPDDGEEQGEAKALWSGKASEALESELRSIYIGKKTGAVIDTDPKSLAKAIAEGELNLTDIDLRFVSDELILMIAAMLTDAPTELDSASLEIETDTGEEPLFDPAAAAITETDGNRKASERMLAELYQILEAQNEEKKPTMLDGISEPIDETETLPSPAAAELLAQESSGGFEQIIDDMIEETAAQLEGTPTVQEQTAPAELGDEPNDAEVLQAAVTSAQTEAPTAQPVRTEQAQRAAQTEQARPSAQTEQPQQTEQTAVQTVSGTQQQSSQPENSGAQLSMSADSKVAETGRAETEELQGIIESFTIREANVSETRETAADEAKPESANITEDSRSRVKNATEELEMLRSAKAKPADEKELPAGAEVRADISASIVIKRADGEITVKHADIVDQVMKAVDEAVKVNKEQTEYSLVLNPEELGRITVKIIKAADGAINVQIAAENAHTQRVLEQHAELMQNNLRSSGVNLESWQTVNESRQETYAQDYNGSSKNPYFRQDSQQSGEDNSEGERSFADIIAAM